MTPKMAHMMTLTLKIPAESLNAILKNVKMETILNSHFIFCNTLNICALKLLNEITRKHLTVSSIFLKDMSSRCLPPSLRFFHLSLEKQGNYLMFGLTRDI